jgi:hypothetical protein
MKPSPMIAFLALDLLAGGDRAVMIALVGARHARVGIALHSGHAGKALAQVTPARSRVQETCFAPQLDRRT